MISAQWREDPHYPQEMAMRPTVALRNVVSKLEKKKAS